VKISKALGWLPRPSWTSQISLGGVPKCRRKISDRTRYDGNKKLTGAMWGTTPPWEITTLPRSFCNLKSMNSTSGGRTVNRFVMTHSSSFRMASCKWRGTIRCFLLSRAALPASSRISAARYSNTAAKYTRKNGNRSDDVVDSWCSKMYLVHQLQHVGHSYPSSTDDGHDQQGTGDQLWQNEIEILMASRLQLLCLQICQLFLYQTL